MELAYISPEWIWKGREEVIFQYVNGLIQQAIKAELIEQADNIYVRNQVMNLLNLDTFPEEPDCVTDESIPDMLEKIIKYAIEHEVIEDIFDDKEILFYLQVKILKIQHLVNFLQEKVLYFE